MRVIDSGPAVAEDRSGQSVLMSWSGGKDSCLALQAAQRAGLKIAALITTVTEDFDRISMHGVRSELLRQQATSLGYPLREVRIPYRATNAIYEGALGAALAEFRAHGISQVVFGDLFLEEIKAYRDRWLASQNMTALYPVWGHDTRQLIRTFLAQGFRTIVVCVDPNRLDPSFTGRVIDEQFLRELPETVDPCGENGEFHTFVFDGPIFKNPIAFTAGEIVCRDGFWYCDLLPAG